MTQLDVLLDGRRVAVLDGAARGGLASLKYEDDVVASSLGVPLLSTRLPVRALAYPGVEVRAWMDGLVPEGGVRAAMAHRLRLEEDDLFELLRHYGHDCAGAVTVVDPAEEPDELTAAVRWLTEEELAEAVRDLPRSPFGVGVSKKVRVSLGGVQGKLAVVWDGQRIGLPEGLEPSTHILKPTPLLSDEHERYPGIATAEAMCLRVCHHLGLEVPEVQLLDLQTGPALLVERYDRLLTSSGARRLHQEDLAQALGITSLQKYHEQGRDYPTLLQMIQVLRDHGAANARTLDDVVSRIVAHSLLGNCDGHAKNWSFLLTDGTVRLAPVYDVVPSLLWPNVDTTLAMPVGGCSLLEDLSAEDVRDEAASWPYGRRAVNRQIDRIASSIVPAVEAARHDVAQMGGDEAVVDGIFGIVTRRVASFF